MTTKKEIDSFLSQYNEQVVVNAISLRDVLFANLPGITEQVDIKAKMISYSYGQKYADLICVIIPSKKGLKLGFNRGIELPDPEGILAGNAKISRYVEIKSSEQINAPELKEMIMRALVLYREKTLLNGNS